MTGDEFYLSEFIDAVKALDKEISGSFFSRHGDEDEIPEKKQAVKDAFKKFRYLQFDKKSPLKDFTPQMCLIIMKELNTPSGNDRLRLWKQRIAFELVNQLENS